MGKTLSQCLPVRAATELELRRRGGSVSPVAFAERYWSKPSAWVMDAFHFRPDETPAPYQLASLDLLHERKRLAQRGCHGLGKTAEAAWAILHFAATREAAGIDWKVATTASVWRQLSLYLWPEVHKWIKRMKVLPGTRRWRPDEVQVMNLKLTHGQAFAAASNDKDKIEGAHASEMLYVLDEAKAIPSDTWDAVEGAFAQGNAFAFAISTPGAAVGRFYAIHSRKRGYEDWEVSHVKLEEAIAAGRVSQEWANQRKAQWGEDSPVYQCRVLGEFSEAGDDVLIPLNLVEAAQERWQELEAMPEKLTSIGVDVGRTGDETVLALRCGDVITELRTFQNRSTMETAGNVARLLDERGGIGVIDVIGIGAGVYDRLREMDKRVVPFNAGGRAFEDGTPLDEVRRFANARARAWWAMRDLLSGDNGHTICLPPDDLLTADLTAPTQRVTSIGAVAIDDPERVEGKDTIRKRLGRSTDRGDAVIMAFASDWLPSSDIFVVVG